MRKSIVALALTGALAFSGIGMGVAAAYPPTPRPTTGTQATGQLPAAVAADLAFAREEEKMARDLYALFADKYGGARPFSNITRSEQRHYDAVGALLTRYGVRDPAAGKPAGVFANAEIQRLFNAWKAEGLTSQQAANKVGVALEKRDIADLERQVARTDVPDVKLVFSNLLAGSRHHLAAFTRALNPGEAPGRGPGPRMTPGQGAQPGQWGRQQGGQQGGWTRPSDRPETCPRVP